MNLQQLVTFVTVLNEKSMTAASQKLFLTQPAVSQQIRNLEEEMGVDLLVRGVRQVQPTPQGTLLYDYAKRIIVLTQQAELAIQTMGSEVKGPLRVGTLNSIGLHLISPVVSLFLKNNQNVSLKLRYAVGLDVMQLLESGEIDVAILPDLKKEYGIQTSATEGEIVFRDEICLVQAGKDLPQGPISLRDYANQPVVSYIEEYPGFEKLIEKEIKREGIMIRPIFESSNVGTLKRVIESGLGWGFLPTHSIKKQLSSGRMRKVDVSNFKYSVDLKFYVAKNAKLSKSVEVFLKALQQPLQTI